MFTVNTALITTLILANVFLAAALMVTVLVALQLYAESKERDE